jgi:glutaredoxin
MVTKTEVFDEPSCDDCIIFIEISSEESAELEIHVQSKNSEVELK